MKRTTRLTPDAYYMVHTVSAQTYDRLLKLAGGPKKLPQYVQDVLRQHAESTPNR